MSESEFIESLKFEAVMVMADVFCMDINLQILTDLVMSKDGRIGGPQRGRDDPQAVPIYITNPDLTYKEEFIHQRLSG